jgi:hypothetical protein
MALFYLHFSFLQTEVKARGSRGPSAIKQLLGYSVNYSHFVILEIKGKNNFTLHFKLGQKYVHGMIFILLLLPQ